MSKDKPPDIPGITYNLYSEDYMNQYIENDNVEEILKRDRDKKKEQRRLKRCKELGIDPNLYDEYKYFRPKPSQEQLDERYRKKLKQNAEYYKRRKEKKKLLESLSKTAGQRVSSTVAKKSISRKDTLKVGAGEKSTTYKEGENIMNVEHNEPHTFISSSLESSGGSNFETAQVLLSLKKMNQQETFTCGRK